MPPPYPGISGANINPAVTLALSITRKMSFFRAVCYILAQMIGATLGTAMARHVSPEIFDRYGVVGSSSSSRTYLAQPSCASLSLTRLEWSWCGAGITVV